MKHSLTALSLIGLTLLGAPCLATPTTGDGEPLVPVAFDEILFAPYPELEGSEFLAELKTGRLLEAIAIALNSDGDQLRLNLGGELYIPIPDLPIVALGGRVDLDLTLTRIDSSTGVQYQLEGGPSALTGARLSVWLAGTSLEGTPASSVAWRFSNPVDLVRAIQSLVIRTALGEKAATARSNALQKLGDLSAKLHRVEAVRNQFVGWLARFLPRSVIDELNALQAARTSLVRGVDRLTRVLDLTSAADRFLERNSAYVRLELGTELGASVGEQILEVGGDGSGSLGLELDDSLTRAVTVIVEVQGVLSRGVEVELHARGEVGLAGGVFGSLAASVERELVIRAAGSLSPDGIQIDSTDDVVELSLDRSYTAAAWALVGAQYGAGRNTRAFMDLTTLIDIGAEGVTALVAGNPSLTAGLLVTLPVTFEGQARIERAAYAGLGLEVGEKSLAVGVNVAAWWTDQGDAVEFDGVPTIAELAPLFTLEETEEQIQTTLDLLTDVAAELGAAPPH